MHDAFCRVCTPVIHKIKHTTLNDVFMSDIRKPERQYYRNILNT